MNAGYAGKTVRFLENVCLRAVVTTRRYTNPCLPLPLPNLSNLIYTSHFIVWNDFDSTVVVYYCKI